MTRFRPHTLEEKRKLRNARQKRKRKQKTAKKQEEERLRISKAIEDQKQLTGKLRATAHDFCKKWRAKCEENKKLKDLLVRHQRKEKETNKSPLTEYGANGINADELVSKENPFLLGEGSYGKCLLRTYERLGIQVVEKQLTGVHGRVQLLDPSYGPSYGSWYSD